MPKYFTLDSDLEEMKYGPIEIAIREFDEGVLPITVKRPLVKAK